MKTLRNGPLAFVPFCSRDQAQLDAASVSSIQVVGVVEALIQKADTLFPGGKAPAFVWFRFKTLFI